MLEADHKAKFENKYFKEFIDHILPYLPYANQNDFIMYGTMQIKCFTLGHLLDLTKPDHIVERKEVFLLYIESIIDYISLKYQTNGVYSKYEIIEKFSDMIDVLAEKPNARLDAIFAYEKKLLISRFIKPKKDSLKFYYNSIVKDSVENNINESLEEYFKKINISPEFSKIIDEKNNHNVRYKVTIRN